MPIRIAIIDDSEVVLEWARSCLGPEGFEISTYSHALGIHNFVKREDPDLILLDVTMPALKGDMICRMLKGNEKTRAKRVLLYSSLAEEILKKLCAECTADGYILKCNDSSAFVAQIKRHIDAFSLAGR